MQYVCWSFFDQQMTFMPVEKKMIDRVGERVKKIGRLQLVSWQAETRTSSWSKSEK